MAARTATRTAAANACVLLRRAALAIESSFVLVLGMRLGARRQAMMIVHHSVTLMLIVASWLLGIPETGAVVMWLHSQATSSLTCSRRPTRSPSAALAPIFATLVGWVGFRFVFLPLHLLVPGWRRIRLILFGIDCAVYARCERLAINQPEFILGTTARLLLLVLLGLHTIWLKQLVSKALRVLFPSAPSATSVPAAATAKRATKTALAALDVPDMHACCCRWRRRRRRLRHLLARHQPASTGKPNRALAL